MEKSFLDHHFPKSAKRRFLLCGNQVATWTYSPYFALFAYFANVLNRREKKFLFAQTTAVDSARFFIQVRLILA